LQLLIYYDANGPHELDFRIRKLGDDAHKVLAVGPTEIMLLVDWQAAEEYQSPFPRTEASLDAEVKALAELLRNYGSAFLQVDERAFERLEQLRRDREKELTAPKPADNRLRK
jgi:hypothetical protein